MQRWTWGVAALLLALSTSAEAYIGPGAGLSLIGSLFGWIAGLFLTLFAIILWPLRYVVRRLFRRKRGTTQTTDSSPAADGEPPTAG